MFCPIGRVVKHRTVRYQGVCWLNSQIPDRDTCYAVDGRARPGRRHAGDEKQGRHAIIFWHNTWLPGWQGQCGMEKSPSGEKGDLLAVCRLWHRLSAVLGTAAAAAIVRRTLATVSVDHPALRAVRVEREGLNFVCRIEPPPLGVHTAELVAVGRTLSSILQELTDQVVIRYLARDRELAVFQFAEEGQ
jgi:hypothetical protein